MVSGPAGAPFDCLRAAATVDVHTSLPDRRRMLVPAHARVWIAPPPRARVAPLEHGYAPGDTRAAAAPIQNGYTAGKQAARGKERLAQKQGGRTAASLFKRTIHRRATPAAVATSRIDRMAASQPTHA